MDKITKNFVLQRGCIANRNLIVFTAYNYDAAVQEIPNGFLFILNGSNQWSFQCVKWSTINLDICLQPSLICLVLGRDGEVLIADESGFNEEIIDDQGINPLNRGPLQNIAIIEGTGIAVGMGRQVYRRDSKNRWVRLENGFPPLPSGPKIVGFNAIAGHSLNDIYIVGWGGEIWRYDGQIWKSIESPTNVILHDVLMLPDESLFACGAEGVLLKGRGTQWDIIKYKGHVTNWRTMAWFHEKLYLADGHGLYLLDGDTIVPVNVYGEHPMPVICLRSTDEILLAVAADSAYVTDDGITWTELPC